MNCKIILNEDKELSLLKQTRKEIFSVEDKNFGWTTVYKISFVRKHPEFQRVINFNEEHLDYLVENFKKWYSIPTYLTFENDEGLFYGLASKRGNKIYQYFLNKKLEQDLSFMRCKKFNEIILRNKKGFRNKKVSNCVFITLTCDPKKYNNSRSVAWLNFQHDYNIFITRLRKKYGKCWVMKSVESTEKGFPHIHLLIITQKEVDVFPYKNKEGFIEYRVEEKREIEKYWPSNIDMIIPNPSKMESSDCVDFMKDYIFKDMLKAYSYRKNKRRREVLTLAIGWLFGGRCYSVSRWNRSSDLINDTSVTQTQIKEIIESEPEKNYKFVGLTDFYFGDGEGPPPIKMEIKKSDPNYEDYLNAIYNKKREILEVEKKIDKSKISSY